MPTSTFYNLSQKKQQRITEAAVKEFAKRGITNANLSNIIRDAKISRGSLYQYFFDKQDLYVYVFQTLRKERQEYVEPAFERYKVAPFLDFYEEFYLLDSEYLLMNPQHIEMGKHLYSSSDPVAINLILEIQKKYREHFLIAIEHDKDIGIIQPEIDSSALSDLLVHFVTDIFIFQNIYSKISLETIQEDWKKTRYIIERGITRK